MTEKITFKDAIQKFIHVGEVYFRGHYSDNVLNIFNELTEGDKKALLRGLHQVYFLVDSGAIESIPEGSPPSRRHEPEPEPEDNSPATPVPMTASSTFVIIMLLVLIFILVILFIAMGLDSSPNSAFKKLVRILEFIF